MKSSNNKCICVILFLFFVVELFILKMQKQIEQNKINIKLNSAGLSHVPSEDKFHIFLVWKGQHIPNIYLKAFETLVKFHQNAEIMILSNELETKIFSGYNNSKNIFIVKYNLTQMVYQQPGYDFVEKAVKILNGQNINNLVVTPVHISDFLRYFLVYSYGGLYLDFDMFVLRNLESYKNTIGVDQNKSHVCSKKVYDSPKAKQFTCLCNCMFSFDRHHPFLEHALTIYEKWWSECQGYGPGGGTMLFTLLEYYYDKINFMPNEYWICNKYIRVRNNELDDSSPAIQDAINNCFVFHFYGSGDPNFKIENIEKTLLGRVYNRISYYSLNK
ncbi:unnamed protein product [Brachionus calyciflorus]|uniref:Alpha-1,4-N-acetylglucosaminyltransferase n=1 Tax=Brachionus calyciflorus TaxID=104777 RepID=A0A814ANJ3_9BILA|nr:unnamed protein product [Brachionus calyciflorus]